MVVALKEDSLVLITENDGSLPLRANGPLGLYYHDTQFLSGLGLRINGLIPELLSADTQENYVATFQLIQPKTSNGPSHAQGDGLLVRRTRFLADGWRERIELTNCRVGTSSLHVEVEFEAAFKDMFAVRGYHNQIQEHSRSRQSQGRLLFEQLGRDGVRRVTEVVSQTTPAAITGTIFHFRKELATQETLVLEFCITPSEDGSGPPDAPENFDEAIDALNVKYRRFLRSCTRFTSSNGEFDQRLLKRSALDLRALIDFEPTGPYITAGIPWFAVPFGRDGLIAAYQTLAWNPDIAVSTLRFLAHHQGKKLDSFTEEEPGKIMHELRRGELARLGEVPHQPYYGTVDATPLFVLLFAQTVKWTGDTAFYTELLPHAERALTWCQTYGDPDQDGYIEYGSRAGKLRNQGWKDSPDSLTMPDGQAAQLPAALVEVQAYLYGAKIGMAELYQKFGQTERSQELYQQAAQLQQAFEKDFWMEDESCYAQALDASKQQVPAVTSNAGHALFAGIASQERARRLVERLLAPDMFTGWGVRTLSTNYPTYNPMSYHNGSVWPHDNSLLADGFARYGQRAAAAAIISNLIEAGAQLDDNRLPELFCGFPRDLRFSSRPAGYKVSCVPQAWSAAVSFLFLQTLLGLRPDQYGEKLLLEPMLPTSIERIRVRGLRFGAKKLDFLVTDHGKKVVLDPGVECIQQVRERRRSPRD